MVNRVARVSSSGKQSECVLAGFLLLRVYPIQAPADGCCHPHSGQVSSAQYLILFQNTLTYTLKCTSLVNYVSLNPSKANCLKTLHRKVLQFANP